MTARSHPRLEDLPRRGRAPRTHPCDSEAVKPRSPPDRRAPDQRNAAEIRPDVLSRLHEQKVAERTVRIHLAGIRLLDAITLPRPWPVLTRMRPRHRPKLPVVVSPRAVRALVASVVNPQAGRCLRLIEAGGWRLREGTPLQVADSAPDRMLVRVRQGPGGQDRVVPLAARTLERWRVSGPRAHPRPWWCPARDQQTPLPATTLQQTLTRVVRQRGLATDASRPTRRPASATQRVARGSAWRVRHARRGHQRPRTTARDTPLPATTFAVVQAPSTARMAALSTCRSPGLPAVAAVCRRDGPDDRARCGADRRPSHRRARAARIDGRTEAFGGPLWPCDPGGHAPDADHAGRHRRGPTCPHQATDAGLAARRQALLPVPYVHVVGTGPHARGEVVRRPHQDLDALLLRAAAHARLTLAADPHDVGGRLGVWGVRHTWTRPLAYQPHVPGLVPAGGGAADRTAWRPARASSVVPVQALAPRFRGRCRALVPHERPDRRLPESVWTRGWVVSGQPAVHRTEQIRPDLGRDGPPGRADHPPPALHRGEPGLRPRPGRPRPALADHALACPGVPPSLAPAGVASGVPPRPLRWAVESCPASPPAPAPALPGRVRRRSPTPRCRTRAAGDRCLGPALPRGAPVSSWRSGPARRDPPAPAGPAGATMRPRAPVWPPPAGSLGAAGCRNRGPLLPVGPPPGHPGRTPAAPAPCGPRIPPGGRVLTPLPTSRDHRAPPII